MPRKSPYVITLSAQEHAQLERYARRYTSPYRDVIRAKIVLLAAQDIGNDVIAARLDTPRQSSASGGIGSSLNASEGWTNSPAAGAQPAFPPSVVVEVKRLACEIPSRAQQVLQGRALGQPRSPCILRCRTRHRATADPLGARYLPDGIQPSCSSASWIRRMPGWLSARRVPTSRAKRCLAWPAGSPSPKSNCFRARRGSPAAAAWKTSP